MFNKLVFDRKDSHLGCLNRATHTKGRIQSVKSIYYKHTECTNYLYFSHKELRCINTFQCFKGGKGDINRDLSFEDVKQT